jgi:hypothetical protein
MWYVLPDQRLWCCRIPTSAPAAASAALLTLHIGIGQQQYVQDRALHELRTAHACHSADFQAQRRSGVSDSFGKCYFANTTSRHRTAAIGSRRALRAIRTARVWHSAYFQAQRSRQYRNGPGRRRERPKVTLLVPSRARRSLCWHCTRITASGPRRSFCRSPLPCRASTDLDSSSAAECTLAQRRHIIFHRRPSERSSNRSLHRGEREHRVHVWLAKTLHA